MQTHLARLAMSLFMLCLLSLFVTYSVNGETPVMSSAAKEVQAKVAHADGRRHLQGANWQGATNSFNAALELVPTYAPAYIGKLCAELKVPRENLLGNLTVSIDEHPYFEAALENASPSYGRQLQRYAAAINARVKAMEGSAQGTEAGERITLTINGVEYAFRWCPAGDFWMGSPGNERGRHRSNETHHPVVLFRGFWLLETEVTQGMWESVMGNNPSNFKGVKRPVEQVTRNDCQEYIKKLNAMKIAPEGFQFSLPTEAQWEYACRAGTGTAYHFGDTLSREQAHFLANLDQTKEVACYPANAWGLQDMHGNVWEWCLDGPRNYGSWDYGTGGAVIGPTSSGSMRVLRGGGWGSSAVDCRSTNRYDIAPTNRYNTMGLRLALVSSVSR